MLIYFANTGIESNGLPIESRSLPPHMVPLPDDRPTRTSSNKLEDQAATAALYVTNQNNQKPKTGHEFLDSDNKLSSAGKNPYTVHIDHIASLISYSNRCSSIPQIRETSRFTKLPLCGIEQQSIGSRSSSVLGLAKPKNI